MITKSYHDLMGKILDALRNKKICEAKGAVSNIGKVVKLIDGEIPKMSYLCFRVQGMLMADIMNRFVEAEQELDDPSGEGKY